MIIDFKEIPEANKGGGEQDIFELFAREFLSELGFKILEEPNRGPDGGKDFIVEETRTGITRTTAVKWLVSCKHLAHSRKSVSSNSEQDIGDRIKQHKCDAFMGFYSTIQSSGLSKKLMSLSDFNSEVYDSQKIERTLLSTPQWQTLARRFFPMSMKHYLNDKPKPIKILPSTAPIRCEFCRRDLLDTEQGMIGFLMRCGTNEEFERLFSGEPNLPPYHELYFSCYGNCDLILRSKHENAGNVRTGWCDIFEFTNPLIYAEKLKFFIEEMGNNQYAGNAIDKMKAFFTTMFPYISREPTSGEKREAAEFGKCYGVCMWKPEE